MIKCSVCGYDNPDDSQTCLNCGSPIERRKLGQAIDDINGEATVLIGTPLVPPPAPKPSASTNPLPPPPPAPRAPAMPPPPPPAPAAPQSYAPPQPPPPPQQPSYGAPQAPQSHPMPPPANYGSDEVETAKKFGYISIGLGASSILFCLLGALFGGFGCLAFFEWIGGLVVGIIGLKKAGTDASARQLNMIGIGINAALLVLSLLLTIVAILVGGAAVLAAIGAAGASGGN